MKDIEKKKFSNANQTKRSVRSERRDRKLPHDNPRKALTAKEIESKSSEKPGFKKPPSDSKTNGDSPEVYEDVVIHYVDDVNRSEEAKPGDETGAENKDEMSSHSGDMEKELNQGGEEHSDSETTKDSVSSQGDPQTAEEEKVEKSPTSSKRIETKDSTDNRPCATKVQVSQVVNKLQNEVLHKSSKIDTKSNNGPSKAKTKTVSENLNPRHFPPKPSSESSESMEEKPLEDVNEGEILDEVSIGGDIVRSDDETKNIEEHGDHIDQAAVNAKVEEMEIRIENLEEELREVAALEIALYSVVPEHGSSAHKVHTPARRLSRLYVHACKYWSMNKRGTIARNIVSGLVLVAKSCSNDVSRSAFWFSNTVVLREIICQAFGHLSNSNSLSRISELNGGGRKHEGKSSLSWRASYGSKQTSKDVFMQFIDDWQETRTLTAALEKVESWIFARIIESVWWQTITPNMQSPTENSSGNKNMGRLLGPALGDQQQGTFSINLWKSAFEDVLRRLCPVRSGGHTCGCLPVLARMIMEQCVARLDVAMFNAILRESAHEIPTDPVSDPIVDSKVLPIPAGDLSFGSGAQLKNSVGNWSRRLTELLGVDANDFPREDGQNDEDDGKWGGDVETKHFNLLNELSDLLMLPKDMLMDRSIRTEVCPSISLSLVKRILCNFTPDEFCPDPVPGAVLEALNAEYFIEQKFSADSTHSFPYTAPPAMYAPPSPANVAEKVSEIDGKSQLARSSSAIQRKGYTSDEELDELESPLTSLFDMSPSTTPTVVTNGNGKFKEKKSNSGGNARYDLLREVWSA